MTVDDGGFLCGGLEDDAPELEPTAPERPVHMIRNTSRCQCGTYRIGHAGKVNAATTDTAKVTCLRCRRTSNYRTAVMVAAFHTQRGTTPGE